MGRHPDVARARSRRRRCGHLGRLGLVGVGVALPVRLRNPCQSRARSSRFLQAGGAWASAAGALRQEPEDADPPVVRADGYGASYSSTLVPEQETIQGQWNKYDHAVIDIFEAGVPFYDAGIDYPANAMTNEAGVLYRALVANGPGGIERHRAVRRHGRHDVGAGVRHAGTAVRSRAADRHGPGVAHARCAVELPARRRGGHHRLRARLPKRGHGVDHGADRCGDGAVPRGSPASTNGTADRVSRLRATNAIGTSPPLRRPARARRRHRRRAAGRRSRLPRGVATPRRC